MLRVLTILASVALAVNASGSHVAVNLPYLNPAGVQYVSSPALAEINTYAQGISHHHAAPAAYLQHQPAYAAVNTYSQGVASYAPAPAAYVQHHQPAYAAVDTVHHVPAEAHVPVTSVQAHHGVVNDVVDIAKPAVQTRRFEVRRPAIQKQFYDIEERVLIRPAGSALLELDEPLAKFQKGPAVVHDLAGHGVASQAVAAVPVANAAIGIGAHGLVAATRQVGVHAVQGVAVTAAPAYGIAHAPAVAVTTAGIAHQPAYAVGVAHAPTVSITPAPILASHTPIYATPSPIFAGQHAGIVGSTPASPLYDQSDSIVVENADLSRSLPLEHRQLAQQQQTNAAIQHRQEELNQQFLRDASELQLRGQQEVAQQQLLSQQHQQQQHQQQQQQQYQQQEQQQQYQQQEHNAAVEAAAIASREAQVIVSSTLAPALELRSHSASLHSASLPLAASPSVVPVAPHPIVPSVKNSPEVAHHNQAKLIDLLTEKGGVADVGFGRAGPAGAPVGDAGISRARVLAAAREAGHPIGERVNTRRVVVSRPIETVQEFDVLEPATRLERVHVQQPAVFKSLRQDIARVQTSIPVQSKTLVQAHAVTAIPTLGLYH